MDLTSGDNIVGCDGFRDPAGAGVVFTPLAYDGFSWLHIDEPQRDARSACMVVAAFVHLLKPDASLSELENRAEAAVRVLEEGAAWTTVIDDFHRVERAALSALKSPVTCWSRMQPGASEGAITM